MKYINYVFFWGKSKHVKHWAFYLKTDKNVIPSDTFVQNHPLVLPYLHQSVDSVFHLQPPAAIFKINPVGPLTKPIHGIYYRLIFVGQKRFWSEIKFCPIKPEMECKVKCLKWLPANGIPDSFPPAVPKRKRIHWNWFELYKAMSQRPLFVLQKLDVG